MAVMSSSSVPSGSALLACVDEGDGPPLVLLHPGVADLRSWDEVAAALTPSYRVIRYDRRGFGATTYEPEPHDPNDDLLAVLDALGVGRVALVGNSRGGRVAVDFTLAHPERVAALVLVGTAVRGAPDPVLTDDVQALADELEKLEDAGEIAAVNAAEARLWLDGPSRPEGSVGDPARALFLEMNDRALRAVDPGEEREAPGPSAWERLGELALPTCVVVGRHDLPFVVDRSRALTGLVPGARFVELPDAAHVPQLDDPAGLVAVLWEFLAEAYPAGTGQA